MTDSVRKMLQNQHGFVAAMAEALHLQYYESTENHPENSGLSDNHTVCKCLSD